jgi:hypothetical protein
MKKIFVSIFCLLTTLTWAQIEPDSQADNIALVGHTTTEFNLTWDRGNGDACMVVMSTSTNTLIAPVDFQTYGAGSTIFGAGATTGTASFIVYRGTGNSVDVSGLTAGIAYKIQVFEENAGNFKLSTSSGNPRLFATQPLAPNTQASELAVTKVKSNSISLSWVNGNGAKRIVLARVTDPINSTATINTEYSADARYGVGDIIPGMAPGEQSYVIYNGTGTSTTVTDLQPETVYYFQIFEYNENGGGTIVNTNQSYMTTGPTISRKTLVAEAATQAKNLAANTITSSSIDLSWTRGDGLGVIVVAKAGTSVDKDPEGGLTYTANAAFGSGADLGNGNYIVYLGTGTSTVVSNLQPNSKYTFKVMEMTGTSDLTNYNVANANLNPRTLNTATEPVTQASEIVFSNITSSEIQLDWTSGSGERRIVVAREGNAVTQNPADGSTYNASSVFGSGDDLGSSNFVVYDGTSNSITVSGLQPTTTYAFKVFEYNNSIAINYNTANATKNPDARSTVGGEPANQPTHEVLLSRTENSLSFSYDAAIGGASGYVVIRRAEYSVTSIPADGMTYVAGTLIKDEETVVYSGANLSFVANALASNTRYHFKIFAYNGSGETINYNNASPLFFTAKTLAAEPVSQPANFGAINILTTSFDVTYSQEGSPPDGYLVVRKTGSPPSGLPNDETTYSENDALGDGEIVYIGSNKSFSQAGLSINTTYYYRIFAFNGENTEINYKTSTALEASQSTLPLEPGAQPASVSFLAITPTSFTVNFTGSSGGADGYIAFRKKGSATTASPVDAHAYAIDEVVNDATIAHVGSALNFNQANLEPGATYHYVIYAYNGSNGLNNYNTTVGTNRASVLTSPAPPAASAATSVTQDAFAFTWTSVTGATHYLVDVSKDNFASFINDFESKSVTATSITITGLQPGTIYMYRVRAVNASGPSFNSNVGSQITIPSTPTVTDATEIEESSFKINWSASIGASEYLVDVSNDNFATMLAGYNGVTVSALNLIVSGTGGTLYSYRVRAKNSAGISPSSNIGNQKTICTAPASLVASNANSSSFLLQWQAPAGVESYQLDVATDEAFASLVAGYPKIVSSALSTQISVTDLQPSTDYRARIRAVNSAGVSANSNKVLIRTSDPSGGVGPLTISLSNANENSIINKSSITLSASVLGGVPPYAVLIFHKKITEKNYVMSTTAPSQNSSFTATLPIDDNTTDELGLEYYFKVTDSKNSTAETDSKTLFELVNAATAFPIPNLGHGGGRQDYRMFSIPYKLEDSDIGNVFEDMGKYDQAKWRLLHYDATADEYRDYTDGLTTIDQGKSYWFNSRKVMSITLKGTVPPDYSSKKPFAMVLKPGWNQIGNPFLFDISWEAVLAANGNPDAVGKLRVYNPETVSFEEGTVLAAWSGAFVYNSGSQDATLNLYPSAEFRSGRLGRKSTENSRIDEDHWFVPVTVSQGNAINTLTGIGMSTDASLELDRRDELTLPRFMRFLELNSYVPHPRKDIKLARAFVPTANEYTWDLTLESNDYGNEVSLEWDPASLGNNDASLILHDVHSGVIIDMKSVGIFKVLLTDKRHIKIYFSKDKAVTPELEVIGLAYPNPMRDETTIPILMPTDRKLVAIEIINAIGIPVRQLTASFGRHGFHEVVWDGVSNSGQRVPAGVYYYRQLNARSPGKSIRRLIVH